MDGSEVIPSVVIPTGGPREISADIGRLYMMQVDVWTMRTATEINRLGDERDKILQRMNPRQRELAHLIALSLVNILE